MEYALDTNAARAGDKTSNFINESGAYAGMFQRVEALISKEKGTHGIGFTFKTEDGASVNFDVWTVKGNGEKLSGFDAVQAIMTCMKVRGMKPEPMTVEKYDFEAKQTKMTQINGFPSLTGKPIGVFLQKELSIYEGQEKAKMNLVGSFEPDTHLTASEILDKSTTPKNYASKLVWLGKTPVKDSRGKSGSVAAQTSAAPTNAAASDFEDDIPW